MMSCINLCWHPFMYLIINRKMALISNRKMAAKGKIHNKVNR